MSRFPRRHSLCLELRIVIDAANQVFICLSRLGKTRISKIKLAFKKP
jgi:hypothetical protein